MARKRSGGSGQCAHSWGGWSDWYRDGSVWVRTRTCGKCGATDRQVS